MVSQRAGPNSFGSRLSFLTFDLHDLRKDRHLDQLNDLVRSSLNAILHLYSDGKAKIINKTV